MVGKRPGSEALESPPVKRVPVQNQSIKLDQEIPVIDAIRCLGAAMPSAAKSGHPGAPIGCAPIAHALFAHVMRFDPSDEKFLGRDRFVLSNGHACALLYTMLHLATDHLSLDDLRNFRQWNSLTPGHPEANHTKGVEVTTGPLGQGIAQAVGLSLAQHHFAEKYSNTLFDNYTFCIVGDGCMMEGISSEASSLAGTLGLGRLICLYDNNNISIDGSTDLSFTESVEDRYRSYGFQVIEVQNGDEDLIAIIAAIEEAKSDLTRPSFISVKTTIGFKTTVAGTAKAHGAPLAPAELTRFRESYGFKNESDIFDVGGGCSVYYKVVKDRNSRFAAQWKSEFESLDAAMKAEINSRVHFNPAEAIATLPKYTSASKPEATRNLSQTMLNAIQPTMAGMIGGSADLTPSNMTALKNGKDITRGDHTGNYIRFGVREHAMVAIANGLFAHGGFQPFTATFMMFLSYAYPALRLAALSKFSQMFICTHDSIELGEDGPTHQPVEMAPLVRALPNCVLFRPCDGNETAAAYASWLSNQTRPLVASLSRGAVEHYDSSSVEKAMKGGYILDDFTGGGKPQVVLAGSGAEVQLCVAAKKILSSECDVRVVSFPSWELFEEQEKTYKLSVLPEDVIACYVEASSSLGFERYFNVEGSTFLSGFGASAPKNKLFEEFGFTPEKIAKKAMVVVKKKFNM
eukprot:GHVH01016516.1.p1 GENE.GHVH01016516.1~~GHVH01016516.1.p1  ORF type:complete len:687 (+),score=116.83 GHVH01016516.1:55-2115(+)